MQIAEHHVSTGFKLFPNKTYINGEWSDSSGGKTFKVFNPATDDLLGSVPDCNIEDVNRAVESAEKAFRVWSSYTADVTLLKISHSHYLFSLKKKTLQSKTYKH